MGLNPRPVQAATITMQLPLVLVGKTGVVRSIVTIVGVVVAVTPAITTLIVVRQVFHKGIVLGITTVAAAAATAATSVGATATTAAVQNDTLAFVRCQFEVFNGRWTTTRSGVVFHHWFETLLIPPPELNGTSRAAARMITKDLCIDSYLCLGGKGHGH